MVEGLVQEITKKTHTAEITETMQSPDYQRHLSNHEKPELNCSKHADQVPVENSPL